MVKKAKVSITSCIILGMGSELQLQFSSMVYTVRCRTAHLALLIFSELGQKSPFLTIDLEARPALLPVMPSRGDHDK
jgi:hypothetical protein